MKPPLLLVDNGSIHPDATRNLRRLAAALSQRLGRAAHPVSLQHADRIDPASLDGHPAITLEPFLRQALDQDQDQRVFDLVPLFFGPSRALTKLIPVIVEQVAAEHGPLTLRLAAPLCPLPAGEPRLASILRQQIEASARQQPHPPTHIALVDHGSPIPEVTAVRHWLAACLARDLTATTQAPSPMLMEAVMERRPGAEYDFNGELLEEMLIRIADQHPDAVVVLSLLFLFPGRHASADGDIARICARVAETRPRLRLAMTPLVGEHPDLIEILAARAGEPPWMTFAADPVQ